MTARITDVVLRIEWDNDKAHHPIEAVETLSELSQVYPGIPSFKVVSFEDLDENGEVIAAG